MLNRQNGRSTDILKNIDFHRYIATRNPESLHFHTLDLMQHKQNQYIFTILGSSGKPLENFTFYLDVPKSILLREDEEQRIWKSCFPPDDLNHNFDTPKCGK